MRLILTIGSALAIAVGATIALSTPIQLTSMNHLGQPITCGNALRPDSAPATAIDHHYEVLHNNKPDHFIATNYAAQCATLISDKRQHAVSVTTAAFAVVLTISGLTLAIRRVQLRRSTWPDPVDWPNTDESHWMRWSG